MAEGQMSSSDCAEDDFGPLEDYGEAFGCTEIQYLEAGKWVSL
jgi:hypothetical protein